MGGAIGGGGGGGGGGEGGKVDEGEERCVVVRCIRIYEVSSSDLAPLSTLSGTTMAKASHIR